MMLDHPFAAVRVREALNWAKTDEFKTVSDLIAGKVRLCPHCNQPVSLEWAYCKYCGNKL